MTDATTDRPGLTYRDAGVDTDAGDRAVELMRAAVSRTHGSRVVGGVGGFAGLFDVSFLKHFERPLLATSTDGVGTKVALAQAIDKHDTIGIDLVGMVVDDIVVVGATPLFMTDYIACGAVVPERIAAIVAGIARGCAETGTALVGGETAEHPGLLGPDDYDVAGAAVGAVEADAALGAHRVEAGDVVLGLASSGLHSNGYSLVRSILRRRGMTASDRSEDLGGTIGEVLLEPTRLYTAPLVRLLAEHAGVVHALSHVTGGGLAANLARVLPVGSRVEVDRGTWSPQPVFRVLADWGGSELNQLEGTWNLGIGMFAVAAASAADTVIAYLTAEGIDTWQVGSVVTGPVATGPVAVGPAASPAATGPAASPAATGPAAGSAATGPAARSAPTEPAARPAATGPADAAGWVQGAKGVDGGAVRLVGAYRD